MIKWEKDVIMFKMAIGKVKDLMAHYASYWHSAKKYIWYDIVLLLNNHNHSHNHNQQ